MKAFETVPEETTPAIDAGHAPDADELTSWLLAGRFFTIAPAGSITSWSPIASETFGWRRKEIIGEQITERLVPGITPRGYTGGVDAHHASGSSAAAEFAFVPIELSVGYEFNSLLQDISARSSDHDALAGFAKAKHEAAHELVAKAHEGSSDDPAGWLVVFRTGAPAASAPIADNVVSFAAAAGNEEVHAQLERARTDAEDARTELRSIEGQLEEARREAQRARQEVDVSRQEAGDSRDELVVSQRGVEEAKRQLEDARRQTDEIRVAAEEARIRAEESKREADSLRDQLRESRESVRGLAGRADGDLAAAQEREAELERALAAARAEAARHEGEVAPLRERYKEAQRELGTLRAEVESARAEAEETRARLESRLTDAVGRLEARSAEVSEARAEVERTNAELATARAEVERTSAELASARAELERTGGELANVRTQAERVDGELATAKAELEARPSSPGDAPVASTSLEPELEALRGRLERMRAAFDHAPIGSALIAPDGRFVEVSSALCETLGHKRKKLLSGEPPAIVHPDDVDAHRDLFRRILAGEQAEARGVRRYLHADGHPVTMRESVSLIRDDEGRPDLFVVQLEEAHDEATALVVDAEVEPQAPAQPGGLDGDAMRRALEDELFELHSQPVLDLRTNAIAQHELLIRMRSDDGRLILPEAFLGPARRAGLAHAIDRWVVRRAIRLLSETDGISLEVNLSPEAVHDAELPTLVDEELTAASVDPARLVLEVSGATAAESLEETRELAKKLRGLGCRFALDDFRSNFGSFRLIRDLPLDYLKLDGELVSSLGESRTSQLIVKALVDVAAGTGMKTIAVFVSDEDTLQLLRQLGVGFAQGYAVGRPRPVAETLPQLPAG